GRAKIDHPRGSRKACLFFDSLSSDVSLGGGRFVKGFNRVEYRVRPSGPVVQPGMLTSQVSGRRTSGLQTRIWSRDRKVAGSNPARSTKNLWSHLLCKDG